MPAIHHVQIAIPAGTEATARAFYSGMLGLEEIEKPTNLRSRGGLWFSTGSLQLHLGIDPTFTPATKAHIAFEIEDLAGLKQRLCDAGYPITDDEPLPGFERFYVDDPFGNRTELLRRQS